MANLPLPNQSGFSPTNTITVQVSPTDKQRSQKILQNIIAVREVVEKGYEQDQNERLDNSTIRLAKRVYKRDLQRSNSNALFSKNSGPAQSFLDFSPGLFMKQKANQMKTNLMAPIINNPMYQMAQRVGAASSLLLGRTPISTSSPKKEITASKLEEKREREAMNEKVVELLEQISENTENLDKFSRNNVLSKGLPKVKSPFSDFSLTDLLPTSVLGLAAGIPAAGALKGLLTGTGAVAGAKAATIGAATFGAIAASILGTVVDGIIAYGNSSTWKADDAAKVIGSVLGGNGGFFSALSRGATGALAGAKLGAGIAPPMGAIVGALLGGSLGVLAGMMGGQEIAEKTQALFDWFTDDVIGKIKEMLGIADPTASIKIADELTDLRVKNQQTLTDTQKEVIDSLVENVHDSVESLTIAQKGLDDFRQQYKGQMRNWSEEVIDEWKVHNENLANEKARNVAAKRQAEMLKAQLDAEQKDAEKQAGDSSPDERTLSKLELTQQTLETRIGEDEIRLKALTKPTQEEINLRKKIEEGQEGFVQNLPLVGKYFTSDQTQADIEELKRLESMRDALAEKIEIRQRGNRESQKSISDTIVHFGPKSDEVKERQAHALKSFLPPAGKSPAASGMENVRFDNVEGLSNVVLGKVDLANVPHTPEEVIEKENLEAAREKAESDESKARMKKRAEQQEGIIRPYKVTHDKETTRLLEQRKADKKRDDEFDKQLPALLHHLKKEEGDGDKFEERQYHEQDQTGYLYWDEEKKYPKFAMGYGESYIYKNGKIVREVGYDKLIKDGGKLLPKGEEDRVFEQPGGMKNSVYKEVERKRAFEIASAQIEKTVKRIRGEIENHEKMGPIFKAIESPGRRMAILAAAYQMGSGSLSGFNNAWDLIDKANRGEVKWADVAKEFKLNSSGKGESDWLIQTRARANRVIGGIRTGVFEGIGKSAAIGHMAYGPETIHVGDYKGIKNNPEVTMPMSDLEERVLTTVTRMVNLREAATAKSQEIQMMNYESRMKSLLANSEQIAKRVQAKDDLASASKMVSMPPIVHSPVDNKNITTTNQSIIVNRPVENTHNPFLMLT